MKIPNALAASMIAASLMAAPAAFAAEPNMHRDMGTMRHDQAMTTHDMDAFMSSCDTDRDGMLSRAELTKHMEWMFDRRDTNKTGKLDSKQTEAFLRDFRKESGA